MCVKSNEIEVKTENQVLDEIDVYPRNMKLRESNGQIQRKYSAEMNCKRENYKMKKQEEIWKSCTLTKYTKPQKNRNEIHEHAGMYMRMWTDT